LSFWDALILATANWADVPILYSEDLNHGQLYGGVRVLNPFCREAGSPGLPSTV